MKVVSIFELIMAARHGVLIKAIVVILFTKDKNDEDE
jgi:hypothetical protein